MIFRYFNPTTQKNFTKKVYGFDIETYDKNRKFYCGSIYNDKISKMFFNKEDMVEFFKDPMFKNSYVAATNLGFDFMGVFHKSEEISHFNTQFRGSDLIFSRAYTDGKEFYRKRQNGSCKTVTFIDTLNYARLSVKNMGDIIGIPKLKKPACLGRLPNDNKEKKELLVYNLRDSEISYKFILFLFDSFKKLGTSPSLTIASTSMSLFKNHYLKESFYRHDIDNLLDQFKGYYGGRCEVFERGGFQGKYFLYDFNSLYPSVMLNEFPDPNTMNVIHQNTTSYIESYDGVSNVDIYCPYMKYPLLPYRFNNKLLFPYGNFSGYYSHIELRKAMELGYTIKKVHKTYYFRENCRPFYEFVTDLYKKRMEYKDGKNPLEKVVKIILNSLYGKFGQKFMDRDNWIPIPDTIEDLYKIPYDEMIGDYIRVKKQFTEPRTFCIPIWALYVTAYGRIKLHDLLVRSRAIYCDTDSIITTKKYENRTELGKLKLEFPIKYGIIVKPKFYGLVKDNNEGYVKIKGLGARMTYDEYTEFLKNPQKRYTKFLKFKESLRRGMIPNEIVNITKEMDLEDNKRYWTKTFSFNELQESEPLEMEDNLIKVIS